MSSVNDGISEVNKGFLQVTMKAKKRLIDI